MEDVTTWFAFPTYRRLSQHEHSGKWLLVTVDHMLLVYIHTVEINYVIYYDVNFDAVKHIFFVRTLAFTPEKCVNIA